MAVATDRQDTRIETPRGYVSAEREGETFAVRFPYDPDAVVIARKCLPGTWWDRDTRAWRVRRRYVSVLSDRMARIEAVFIARDQRATQQLKAARPLLDAARPALRQEGSTWILEAPYDLRIVELARAACLKWDPRLELRRSTAPDVAGLVRLAKALPDIMAEIEAEKIAAGVTTPRAATRERRLVIAGRVCVGDGLPLPSGAPAVVTRLGKVFRLKSGAAAKQAPDLAGQDVQFAYLRPARAEDVTSFGAADLLDAEKAAARNAGLAAIDLVARGAPVPAFEQEDRDLDVLWQSGKGDGTAAQVCLDGPWIVHLSWEASAPERSIAAHRLAAHPEIVSAIRALASFGD